MLKKFYLSFKNIILKYYIQRRIIDTTQIKKNKNYVNYFHSKSQENADKCNNDVAQLKDIVAKNEEERQNLYAGTAQFKEILESNVK